MPATNPPENDLHDPMGFAMLDFLNGTHASNILVISNIAEDDVIPVIYLFRIYSEMPTVEQVALQHCKGKVLDVGAGAGSHSLWLKENNFDVTSIDTSVGAVVCMKARGLDKVEKANFFEYEGQFDTLLLMMNGIGICGSLDGLRSFFRHAKTLLAPVGQILLDSSDLSFMFEQEEMEYERDEDYYGMVKYQMRYKNELSHWFDWLFADQLILQRIAEEEGFKMEVLCDGEHYDYTARLTLK